MSSELPHTGSKGSGPEVWAIDRCLYARTPLLSRLLGLFSHDRLMVADRESELLTMRRRWLWVIREETTVPFSQVDYLDQEYFESTTTNHPLMKSEFHQTYTVKLVLKDFNGKLELFRFSGTSTASNDPRLAALAFMSVVAETLGVPAGPPVRHYVSEDGTMLLCSVCGRRAGPAAVSCLYCGGALEEAVAVEDDSDLA